MQNTAYFETLASQVNQKIDPKDEMAIHGTTEHYLSVGQSALTNILHALDLAGRSLESVTDILDLPCGHGRVLRWMRAAFPEANITACDLNHAGVDFCAEVLGAQPLHSQEDIRTLKIKGEFDLIWVGSLFTHLSKPMWHRFLRFYASKLKPGGLLLFTTHGAQSVRMIQRGHDYGLWKVSMQKVLTGYRLSGFGYANYPWFFRYGISLSTPAWVTSAIQSQTPLRIVGYNEGGWDNHQDVVTCINAWPQ